jgi:hypothetical protein
MKQAMKIHSDHQPRRLALKLLSAARLSGDNQPFGRLAPARHTDGVAGLPARSSDIACLKVDARIDPHIDQVRKQPDDEAHQREDVERARTRPDNHA